MAFLSAIRRWALREGMSIREIARRTGLSRNTIRKYLRNDTTEPSFKVPNRPSKLDPYAEKLSGWLLTESRKQRRTIKQLHRELVVLGHARAITFHLAEVAVAGSMPPSADCERHRHVHDRDEPSQTERTRQDRSVRCAE